METLPVTVDLFLDTRRKKSSGKYPLKLRIYHEKGEKFYKTPFDLSKEEFAKAWDRQSPRGQFRSLRWELENLRDSAKETIKGIRSFSFEAFEERFFGTNETKGHDVFTLGNRMIQELKEADRLGTADSYRCTVRSLERYLKARKPRKKRLPFEEITPKTLEDYERWMLEEEGKSRTTVGIYTRTLRAIFNQAREEGITDSYPFGRRRYKTPNPKRTKKALSLEELQILRNAEPNSPEQEQAKDLFLLSFLLQGINMQDLASLTVRNLTDEGDRIEFYRQKTDRTAKDQQAPVEVPLTEEAKRLIHKYRRNDLSPNAYLFDFAPDGTKEERRMKLKAMIGRVNQKLKKVAQRNGLPDGLSWQWARHTFATLSITQGGASMEYVSQALGHNDLSTTKNYFAGFSKDEGKEIMEKLTENL